MTEPLTDTQTVWLSEARKMLDWLEEHPDYIPNHAITLDIFCWDEDAPAQLAKAAKVMGRATKDTSGDALFFVRREWGPHHLDVNASREAVCERVQVGTETVEEPDPEAPKVTVERPVYEWRCPPSLLAMADESR